VLSHVAAVGSGDRGDLLDGPGLERTLVMVEEVGDVLVVEES